MKIGIIEQKVKIPEVRSRFKFPWSEMQVGDSVLIEAEKGENLNNLKRKVAPSALYYGQRTDKKFKALLDHDNNGVRVWRLK